MGIVSTAVLALSMSADAFAAALGKGAEYRKPRLLKAIRNGLIFGIIEAITPILGWLLGSLASNYITTVDHWIAFVALSALGGKMIYESFAPGKEQQPRKPSLKLLVLTACATSIDALVVGITLAFLNANIWVAAAAIGFTTFIMATLGMMIGQYAGKKFGVLAERIGGIGLIVIGVVILGEHLLNAPN